MQRTLQQSLQLQVQLLLLPVQLDMKLVKPTDSISLRYIHIWKCKSSEYGRRGSRVHLCLAIRLQVQVSSSAGLNCITVKTFSLSPSLFRCLLLMIALMMLMMNRVHTHTKWHRDTRTHESKARRRRDETIRWLQDEANDTHTCHCVPVEGANYYTWKFDWNYLVICCCCCRFKCLLMRVIVNITFLLFSWVTILLGWCWPCAASYVIHLPVIRVLCLPLYVCVCSFETPFIFRTSTGEREKWTGEREEDRCKKSLSD